MYAYPSSVYSGTYSAWGQYQPVTYMYQSQPSTSAPPVQYSGFAAAIDMPADVTAHHLAALMAKELTSADLLRSAMHRTTWILEFDGDSHLRTILDAMSLPYVVLTPNDILTANLDPSETILAHSWYEAAVDSLPEAAITKINQFVCAGGRLISFQGAIRLVHYAFPGYIAESDKRLAAATPAQVMFGTEEPAFAVYARDGRQCIIEKAAKGVRVLDLNEVRVLAKMPIALLGQRAVVLKFQVEKGVVYHFVSRLFAKSGIEDLPAWLAKHGVSASSPAASALLNPAISSGSVQTATSVFPFTLALTHFLTQPHSPQ